MRKCKHCGNDRGMESVGEGVLYCPVCSKLTKPE